MNDEEYLDSLKGEARRLRYEPVDPLVLERIRERIAARLEPRSSVFDVLVLWARPVGVSLAAAALALALGLYSLNSSRTTDLLGESEVELALMQESSGAFQ